MMASASALLAAAALALALGAGAPGKPVSTVRTQRDNKQRTCRRTSKSSCRRPGSWGSQSARPRQHRRPALEEARQKTHGVHVGFDFVNERRGWAAQNLVRPYIPQAPDDLIDCRQAPILRADGEIAHRLAARVYPLCSRV